MKYTAVIFDVDGTLLDSREYIFQAYEYTLSKHGFAVPDRLIIAEHIGKSLADCYAALAPNADFEKLHKTHHDFQTDRVKLITSYKDLESMLSSLKTMGLKLAIVSSRKGNLMPSLEQAGIAHYFDAIVQGDDVTRGKPHPEGLLKALELLKAKPTQAVMIGDSMMDIEAGKAAGVALTIGLTHGFGTREALVSTQADYIIDELANIPTILEID